MIYNFIYLSGIDGVAKFLENSDATALGSVAKYLSNLTTLDLVSIINNIIKTNIPHRTP